MTSDQKTYQELEAEISRLEMEIIQLKNQAADLEIEKGLMETKIYKEAITQGIHDKLSRAMRVVEVARAVYENDDVWVDYVTDEQREAMGKRCDELGDAITEFDKEREV